MTSNLPRASDRIIIIAAGAGDEIMASPGSPEDLLKPNHISSSVSANDTLQFLEDYGFFYQENAKIGKLVDELFKTGRSRSDDARLDHFQPTLREDFVSRT